MYEGKGMGFLELERKGNFFNYVVSLVVLIRRVVCMFVGLLIILWSMCWMGFWVRGVGFCKNVFWFEG